jgi:hypothetical protein
MIEQIDSKPELLCLKGVLEMTIGHSLVHEADRNDEVKRKLVNDISCHTNQNSVCSILEVGELDIEWSELYTPSNIGIVGRGRFKSHRVPVCGLYVFKMANIIGLGHFSPPVRCSILLLLSLIFELMSSEIEGILVLFLKLLIWILP